MCGCWMCMLWRMATRNGIFGNHRYARYLLCIIFITYQIILFMNLFFGRVTLMVADSVYWTDEKEETVIGDLWLYRLYRTHFIAVCDRNVNILFRGRMWGGDTSTLRVSVYMWEVNLDSGIPSREIQWIIRIEFYDYLSEGNRLAWWSVLSFGETIMSSELG